MPIPSRLSIICSIEGIILYKVGKVPYTVLGMVVERTWCRPYFLMCLSTVFFSRGAVLPVETHWVQLQISFLEGIATPSSASKHILELVISIMLYPLSIIPNRHSDIISDVIKHQWCKAWTDEKWWKNVPKIYFWDFLVFCLRLKRCFLGFFSLRLLWFICDLTFALSPKRFFESVVCCVNKCCVVLLVLRVGMARDKKPAVSSATGPPKLKTLATYTTQQMLAELTNLRCFCMTCV